MSPEVSAWLNLFFRWFHVVAGVLWLGQTALFSWMDLRMRKEVTHGDGDALWMVHSGGFYRVEKLAAPETMPKILHWFKWEAAFSWLSGMLLLGIVYHLGGLMVDYDSEMSVGSAIRIGLGAIILGWVVYDLLWRSPLARQETLANLISVALLIGTAWLLTQYMSGRAAYIHVGALMGTIMTFNVWVHILPGQRKMIAAVKEGREPNLRLGVIAKHRSHHNTFLAFPLLFIMISSHFPTNSYGHRLNWLFLGGYILLGFLARWLVTAWERR